MMSDLQRFIHDLRNQPEYLVLDTETTGLGSIAEVCQIAIINQSGDVLMDTLIKTRHPIPADASNVHRITDDMVASAPTWLDVRDTVFEMLRGRPVVIYNADYDVRIMFQSDRLWSLSGDWDGLNTTCAMLAASEYIGDWNDYHGNYRWQKLTTVHHALGCPRVSAPAHSALGDCLMTLNVTRALLERVRR